MRKLFSIAAILVVLSSCDKQTITIEPDEKQNDTYKINGNAAMPAIKLNAKMKLLSGDVIKKVWADVSVIYNGNGRKDTLKFQQKLKNTATQSFTLGFSQVRGGKLTVICRAVIKPKSGKEITISDKEPYKGTIIGTPPVKQTIRNFVNDNYVSVLLFLRSNFRQFNSDGSPYFVRGFGLVRISSPRPEQIWSWQKNAEFAKTDFAAKKTQVSLIPAQLRQSNPQYMYVPDFTAEQLNLETIQSYGNRRYYKPQFSYATGRWEWVVSSDNDGFAAKADSVLREVANNRPPPGWN